MIHFNEFALGFIVGLFAAIILMASKVYIYYKVYYNKFFVAKITFKIIFFYIPL